MGNSMWIIFDVGCVAFLFSVLLTPFVRDLGLRWRLLDRPDGARKIHVEPIPRLGGVAVALAYTLALGFILVAPYSHLKLDIPRSLAGAFALAPAALLIFLTGLVDDVRGLKPWQKVVCEVIAAAWAYHGGFGIHILRGHVLEHLVSIPISILWLVGCTNAVNLIDGMDGLASGIGFCAAVTTLTAALINGNVELALVTAPLAGSLLGFLRYNFNPASIFLGDCGSLLVGFLLGCYGALWSHKSATVLGMTAPLMALAVPLLDVIISIIRRFLRGQAIFSADRGHIHHRLLDSGLTPRRAALLLYGISSLAAVFSLFQDLAYTPLRAAILVLFCTAVWVGVQRLNYAEFGLAGSFLFGGSLRRHIDIQLRLRQFEVSLAEAKSIAAIWATIVEGTESFGFPGIRLQVDGTCYRRFRPDKDPSQMWQLRIPLGDSQYLNLYYDSTSDIHPLVLNESPKSIQSGLFTTLNAIANAPEKALETSAGQGSEPIHR
jgi:UDP-GlcNAc:undecaprenyl-phosphate/decaprenyl-phosphate GlcNAc-1-phosphate transferase